MIKSFCIAGDSWGCGEWSDSDKFYPGGKQYDLQRLLLSSGAIVGDVSIPAAHNLETIGKLEEFLKNSPIDFDYIIWFQSDPLRRPEFVNKLHTAKDFSLDYNFFVNESNRYLHEDYSKLNSIGKKIFCIGGLSKLNTMLMSQHSNLVPFIESFPEFLYPSIEHPKLCIGNWMLHINRQVSLAELDLIHQDHINMTQWSTKEFSTFFKEGDGHPNKFGYKQLTNFILNNISNF